MVNAPRSSFIPRKQTYTAPKPSSRPRVVSVFSFIATALMIAALFAAVGVFVYKGVLDKNLVEYQNVLVIERDRFNQEDFDSVLAFNGRLELAAYLLNMHMSPTKIFEALERATKESVQYKDFSYVRNESGSIALDFSGTTDNFAKVALQALEYSDDFVLNDLAVTSVSIDTTEDEFGVSDKQVNFSVLANISPAKVKYEAAPEMIPEPIGVEDATSTATTTVETIIPTESGDMSTSTTEATSSVEEVTTP